MIAPNQNQRFFFFFNERFMASRHEEGRCEKKSSHIFFLAKDYETMTSGWPKGHRILGGTAGTRFPNRICR